MKYFIKFFFVLSIIVAGCSDDDQANPQTADNDDSEEEVNSLQANPAPAPRDCSSTSSLEVNQESFE